MQINTEKCKRQDFFYTKVENKQYKAETTSFTLIIHLWSETNSSQII